MKSKSLCPSSLASGFTQVRNTNTPRRNLQLFVCPMESLVVSVFSPLPLPSGRQIPNLPAGRQVPNQMSQLVYTCHSVYHLVGKWVLVICVVGGASPVSDWKVLVIRGLAWIGYWRCFALRAFWMHRIVSAEPRGGRACIPPAKSANRKHSLLDIA